MGEVGLGVHWREADNKRRAAGVATSDETNDAGLVAGVGGVNSSLADPHRAVRTLPGHAVGVVVMVVVRMKRSRCQGVTIFHPPLAKSSALPMAGRRDPRQAGFTLAQSSADRCNT